MLICFYTFKLLCIYVYTSVFVHKYANIYCPEVSLFRLYIRKSILFILQKEALTMTLGEKLRIARNAQQLSQEELAMKSNFPLQTIKIWESGLYPPPDEFSLKAVCDALQISVEDFYRIGTDEYPLDALTTHTQVNVSDVSVQYETGTSPAAQATIADYWNLPEWTRAELIDGKLYSLAAPGIVHQLLLIKLCTILENHIKSKNGTCVVLPAPFGVNLNADDKTMVEPDVMVVCDRNKLGKNSCKGAPDFVIEIVSPSSRRKDYITKCNIYSDAGVREYWIIDPERKCTTIYHFKGDDVAPMMIPFDQPVTVGIMEDLSFCIRDLIDENLLVFD